MEGAAGSPGIPVSATVRGMGREAICILETWTERSSTGRVFTRCRILDHPSDLPDGTYEFTIAGKSFSTKRWSGVWDLIYLPPSIRVDDAA